MAERSFPFDAVDSDRILDTMQWSRLNASLATNGSVAGFAEEMRVTTTSPTSLGVRVRLGRFHIEGRYFEVFSEPQILPVATAHSSNPRIDRVVVRRDLAARSITAAVITGTPAASPEPPALTRQAMGVWEEPLALVTVPANASAISSSNITDERAFARPALHVGGWEPAVLPGSHRGFGQVDNVTSFTIDVPPLVYERIRLTLRGSLSGGPDLVFVRVNGEATAGLHRRTWEVKRLDTQEIIDSGSDDSTTWRLARWSDGIGNLAHLEIYGTQLSSSMMPFMGGGARMAAGTTTRHYAVASGQLASGRTLSSLVVGSTLSGRFFNSTMWWLEGYRGYGEAVTGQ